MSGAVPVEWRRAIVHGLIVGGLFYFVWMMLRVDSFGHDASAYWNLDLAKLYGQSVGEQGFFAYSPAAALVAWPLGLLPWPVFLLSWWFVLLVALAWMGQKWVLLLLAFPPVGMEISTGNIHILLAAAIVLGFRFPAAWALVLLTKVTPGIGLLWFVARREWRNLAIALGATGAIAAFCFLFLPTQWAEWLGLLARSTAYEPIWPAVPVSLWIRLPLSGAIVWWGARRDAYWTVPVAATLALPVLWVAGLSMLVACLPAARLGAQRRTAAANRMSTNATARLAGPGRRVSPEAGQL